MPAMQLTPRNDLLTHWHWYYYEGGGGGGGKGREFLFTVSCMPGGLNHPNGYQPPPQALSSLAAQHQLLHDGPQCQQGDLCVGRTCSKPFCKVKYQNYISHLFA